MPRATKIVATLGPASSDPEVLERLLRAGVDVVRLNFSHGKAQDHIDRANLVRSIAEKVGKPSAMEQSMLDFAENVRETSRLSCQIKIRDDLEGLRVTTPESQH